jgi:hypothetical protein
MSIDIAAEGLLSLSQAARRCPGRPHISTLWRWVLDGCRGVRLETVMVGGRRFTSTEALQRFADSLTAAACGEQGPPIRTPRARRTAIAQAERDLARDGI